MFFVQSIGLLFGYVFLDGEDGTRRTAKVENSPILAGMYTSQSNAESLESLFAYLQSHEELDGKELILYGNIPGLSYYLDRPCAVSYTHLAVAKAAAIFLCQLLLRTHDSNVTIYTETYRKLPRCV